MTELETLEDGCVRVKVRMYGIEKAGVVSSYHLVEPKERQLAEAIVRSCKQAYDVDGEGELEAD